MSFATTHCRAAVGIDAPLVSVETPLANGLPAFNIVGLPEKAVQESRDRVRSALLNTGFEFPARRITVNLAPADLPKQGSRFDLAIAVGILIASGQLPPAASDGYELVGELSLAGTVRPVAAILPITLAARSAGAKLVLPAANLDEAALVTDIALYPVDHLLTLSGHLGGSQPVSPASVIRPEGVAVDGPDLRDVHGQTLARRALEVAAAGRHNLLMMGPPGSGKSMLANRLPGILPPLDEHEALQTAALRSVAGLGYAANDWSTRPFRAPHHTASAVALVGGGSLPRPGEISLAHNGVLFLDELPEFDMRVLEVLREPLESGRILISRAARQAEFPADFQLVAAMNPCPCGYLGDAERRCHCTPQQIQRYRARISGPLLDRIDLHVAVHRLPAAELLDPQGANEDSATVRARVCASRALQLERQGCANAQLPADRLARVCQLADASKHQLASAARRMTLSGRALHRTLRVARTIADLAQSPAVASDHLSEALAYRAEESPP